MKVTVRLADDVSRLLEAEAARAGTSATAVATHLLEDAVRRHSAASGDQRLLPLTDRQVRGILTELLVLVQFLAASTTAGTPARRAEFSELRDRIRASVQEQLTAFAGATGAQR